jgi:regulatory protein
MSELGSKEKKGAKQSPSLKARALRLLSLREYSRKGMAAKLAESEQRWVKLAKTDAKESSNADQDSLPVKSTAIEIDTILDDFEARGWLSDDRFAEALVRRRSDRYGIRKIQDELERAGVDSSKSAPLLKTLKETEYQRAYELWSRKFGAPAQDQKEKAKHYRFLASKGFSSEVVVKVIAGQRQD